MIGKGWGRMFQIPVPHLDMQNFLHLADALGDSAVIRLIPVNQRASAIIQCICT